MSLFDQLQEITGMSTPDLYSLLRTAPQRYKVYTIPKRSGGQRTIAQPAREVKYLQSYLVDNVLTKLPVHPAAAAYVSGKSIRDNASRHSDNSVILKLDFTDFFPSIRLRDWRKFCNKLEQTAAQRASLLTDTDIEISGRVLFWGRGTSEPRCLSIGAPSSPMLSNIMMFHFDVAVTTEAHKLGVVYSRYADDITLSADYSKPLIQLETFINRYLSKNRSPALTLNDNKRGLYTAGQKRMVTGLLITPEGKISLGRDRKRLISSMVHHFQQGTLGAEEKKRLQGLLAFAYDVEPTFIKTMMDKYGRRIVRSIMTQ